MCPKISLPSYSGRAAAGIREAHTKGWWHEGDQDGQAYLSADMTQRFGVLRASPAAILLNEHHASLMRAGGPTVFLWLSLPKEAAATVAAKFNRIAGDCVVQLSILTGLR